MKNLTYTTLVSCILLSITFTTNLAAQTSPCIERMVSPTKMCNASGDLFYNALLVFPSVNNPFYLIENGEFQEFENGTAVLNGILVNTADHQIKFQLNIQFEGRVSTGFDPIQSLCFPTIDGSNFYYYPAFSGSLTGMEAATGAVINISPFATPLQLGYGANRTNNELSFGASTKFNFQTISNPTTGLILNSSTQTSNIGELVLNLTEGAIDCSQVVDEDEDGFIAAVDCDDNNPAVPATPGAICDDGDIHTIGDIILEDGCTCAGTFDPCAANGGDNDNDGICALADCDDNNPNLPAAPGTACDDGDPNTENDVIQADSCGCQGVIIATEKESICSSDTNDCLEVILHKIVIIADGSLEYEFEITNDCNYAISNVAFQLADGTIAIINGGGKYVGLHNSYHVENPTNNPFYSVKFETIGEGIKEGASERFKFSIPSSAIALIEMNVQVKMGNKQYDMKLSTCQATASASLRNANITFEAYQANRQVALQWANTNGIAGTTYSIERSVDRIHFASINETLATSSSAADMDHVFTQKDAYPAEGNNYYRLKIRQPDGLTLYSNIRQVFINPLENLDIFPNPATEVVTVNFKNQLDKGAILTIVNQFGQQIKQIEVKAKSQPSLTINLEGLQNGLYYLNIHIDNQQQISKRLLVNRMY